VRWPWEVPARLRRRAALAVVLAGGLLVAGASPTLEGRWDAAPLDPERAAALIRGSTVQLLAFGCNLQRREGTAVAIGPGRLLTNNHVVNGTRLIDVVADERPTTVADAPSIAAFGDVASVTVQGLALAVLSLAPADAAAGSDVLLAGYPSSSGGTGLVIERERVVDYVRGSELSQPGRVMRLDGASRPGMSGGPVVDASGHLVGIVFGNEVATGHALVIPASSLRRMLKADSFVQSAC